MISIIIPLYNKETTIVRTIKSILAQTNNDYEIIIVDDGSTDDSLKQAYQVKDNRIKIITQTNSGVSAARNRGIHEAKGEFVAFLDADDIWKNDYLETQVALINKYPQCNVFALNYIYRDENNRTTPTKINRISFKGTDGILTNYFEVAACSNPPIWTSAVIVTKSAILAVGGFPIGINTGEDLLVWAKLACRYKIAYSTIDKVYYEMPSGGTLRVDPKDMSLKNDLVRKELLTLLKTYTPIGWKVYLSFWDKMRSVINLKKGERKESLKYAMRSLFYNPLNYKSIILTALTISPQRLINYILR